MEKEGSLDGKSEVSSSYETSEVDVEHSWFLIDDTMNAAEAAGGLDTEGAATYSQAIGVQNESGVASLTAADEISLGLETSYKYALQPTSVDQNQEQGLLNDNKEQDSQAIKSDTTIQEEPILSHQLPIQEESAIPGAYAVPGMEVESIEENHDLNNTQYNGVEEAEPDVTENVFWVSAMLVNQDVEEEQRRQIEEHRRQIELRDARIRELVNQPTVQATVVEDPGRRSAGRKCLTGLSTCFNTRRRLILGVITIIIASIVLGIIFGVVGGDTGSTGLGPSQNGNDTTSVSPTFSPTDSPETKHPSNPPTQLPTTSPSTQPPFLTLNWSQLGKDLVGEDVYDYFGEDAVALSSDGKVLGVGAQRSDRTGDDSGRVHIFQYDQISSDWVQMGQTLNGNTTGESFGSSVALSSDGAILAVGAPAFYDQMPYASVFQYNVTAQLWSQVGPSIEGSSLGDSFGWSVALSSDGSIAAAGAPDGDLNGERSGFVRVFQYNSTGLRQWDQVGQTLNGELALSHFGTSLALSSDGRTLAGGVGLNDGETSASHVRVFTYDIPSKHWHLMGQALKIESVSSDSHWSVALSADGKILAVSGAIVDSGGRWGLVRTFEYDSDTDQWYQLGQDLKSEENFRWVDLISVALSSNASRLATSLLLVNDVEGSSSQSDWIFAYNKVTQGWEPIGHGLRESSLRGVATISEDGKVVATGEGFSAGTTNGLVRVFAADETPVHPNEKSGRE